MKRFVSLVVVMSVMAVGCSKEEEENVEPEKTEEYVQEQIEREEASVDLSLIEEKEMAGVSDPEFEYVERLNQAGQLDQYHNLDDVPDHMEDKRKALESVKEVEGVRGRLEEGYELFAHRSPDSRVDVYVGKETDPDNPRENRIKKAEGYEFYVDSESGDVHQLKEGVFFQINVE